MEGHKRRSEQGIIYAGGGLRVHTRERTVSVSHGRRSRRASAVRRVVLWVGLALLVWPVVSGLASPRVGRASRPVSRGDRAVAASRRARLAELDVSAAAVRLLGGNVLTGTATVGNAGAVRARSSTADVAWKSSDSGGLVQVGRFQVPALKPGQRHKAKFQFDLPKGASGSYGVSVCADVLGQVQERSKKDNCRDAGVITVSGSGVKASGPTSSEPSPPSGSPPGGSSPTPASPTPASPASSPPDTVIDSGPSGTIGVSSVTFTFHGSDTNDSFQCSLDGAPWAACTNPQQYSSLADGAHMFQVRAVNAAGEVDPAPASASFTVEATPPQTTITSAPSGRIPTGEVSISFTSTEVDSSFKCSLDGAAYSVCSSPHVIKDPAAGPHTFSVQATNQVGVKETATSPSASWSSVEPQHDLCGTISSSATIGPDYAARYIVNCDVTVASPATLTTEPGTIVKADQGMEISVDGTLGAVGTASEPVTFTSFNDSSVGGTTGSGSPAAGDWEGIRSSGGGSVDLEHATVSYATRAVQAEGSGTTAIESDLFTSEGYGAVAVSNDEAPAPTLEDDSAIDASIDSGADPDFSVDSGSLNADLLGGNSATGGGSQVVQLSGVIGASSTLAAEPAAWGTSSELDVPSGKTLTIAPGAVIKGSGGNGCGPEDVAVDCSIGVEGSLVAVGTTSEPITFTSINDNSVGGDTGIETPQVNDWYGIYSDGKGSVDLEHVKLSYAVQGVQADGSGTTTLKSDAFASEGYGAVVISNDDAPAPTLEDDSANDSSIDSEDYPDFSIDADSLNANLLGGNSATGTGSQVVRLSGIIGTSSTLAAEPAAWGTSSELDVPTGKTLTIAPGAVIKGSGSNGCGPSPGDYCSIGVEGTLVAAGTASEPITFTSINDNSVGGTTGSGTPEAGDWYGIYSDDEGAVDLEHVKLSYAERGVEANGSGTTVIKSDAFTSEGYGAVAVANEHAPPPTLENNSSDNSGSDPSFSIASRARLTLTCWAVTVPRALALKSCS